jgi:hypothetical protein
MITRQTCGNDLIDGRFVSSPRLLVPEGRARSGSRLCNLGLDLPVHLSWGAVPAVYLMSWLHRNYRRCVTFRLPRTLATYKGKSNQSTSFAADEASFTAHE